MPEREDLGEEYNWRWCEKMQDKPKPKPEPITFQVGDIVRLTPAGALGTKCCLIKPGLAYELTKVSGTPPGQMLFMLCQGKEEGWLAHRFELVSRPSANVMSVPTKVLEPYAAKEKQLLHGERYSCQKPNMGAEPKLIPPERKLDNIYCQESRASNPGRNFDGPEPTQTHYAAVEAHYQSVIAAVKGKMLDKAITKLHQTRNHKAHCSQRD